MSNSVKGLSTVALLKSFYDQGQDYFEMFVPFTENAIQGIGKRRFTLDDVRTEITRKYGLKVPDYTLKKLITRCINRKGNLERVEGHYILNGDIEVVNIESSVDRVSSKVNKISKSLKDYAKDKDLEYVSVEDASSALFEFIKQFKRDVLLNGQEPYQGTGSVNKENKVISRFIYEECQNDPELYDCLDTILKGYTLQDAMFLRDLNTPSDSFEDLTIYFDSGFLFGLLGYEGKNHERAYNETISLLKEVGASIRCFETTVEEMKRILSVYERKLMTSAKRDELRPTPLTRYFLHNRYKPSDIEQIISLLENKINEVGLQIDVTPERIDSFTLDEEDLAERLTRDDSEVEGYSDRVDHDLDCTAAIVTLRRSQEPPDLDNARAVFASTSVSTVATVNDWYEDQGMSGVPPALTVSEVANRAWLKQPSAASDLKMNELVALCYAALRPSESAWNKFLDRLEDLVESGEIGSDEAAAVVASRFTDESLAKAEERSELDESTLDDVIYRVKQKYKEEANQRVEEVRKEADQRVEEAEREVERISERLDEQTEKSEELENSLDRLVRIMSKGLSGLIFYFVLIVLITSAYIKIPDALSPYNISKTLSNIVITVFTALALFNISYGVTLDKIRSKLESYIHRKLRNRI